MRVSEQADGQSDPQPSITLISILSAYILEEIPSDELFLIKDGVKIIL